MAGLPISNSSRELTAAVHCSTLVNHNPLRRGSLCRRFGDTSFAAFPNLARSRFLSGTVSRSGVAGRGLAGIRDWILLLSILLPRILLPRILLPRIRYGCR